MVDIDFDRLTKTNIGIAVWYYEEHLAVTISVGKRGVSCNFDYDETFFPEFIEVIDKVMNISSFVLTLYTEGDAQHITTTTDVLKRRLKVWQEKKKRKAKFEDITDILK